MTTYLEEVRKLEKRFMGMELQHIPRGDNSEADETAKHASCRAPQSPDVFEERLLKPSAATSGCRPRDASQGAPSRVTHGRTRLRSTLRDPSPAAT